jgi:hypothetical protein
VLCCSKGLITNNLDVPSQPPNCRTTCQCHVHLPRQAHLLAPLLQSQLEVLSPLSASSAVSSTRLTTFVISSTSQVLGPAARWWLQRCGQRPTGRSAYTDWRRLCCQLCQTHYLRRLVAARFPMGPGAEAGKNAGLWCSWESRHTWALGSLETRTCGPGGLCATSTSTCPHLRLVRHSCCPLHRPLDEPNEEKET